MEYTAMENRMARQFHLIQQSQGKQGELCRDMELSLWASPAYRLSEDKKEGNMSCDTYTYRIYKEQETGKYLCEVSQKRAEGRFLETARGIVMTEYNWYTIQAMRPWEYTEDPFAHLGKYPPLPGTGMENPEEYLKIRNVQNMFFERRLYQAGDLFSDLADTRLTIESLSIREARGKEEIVRRLNACLDEEQENRHCYRFLGITGMPVIEIGEDGQTAQGLSGAEIFLTDASSGQMEDWVLRRKMSLVRTSFRKERGRWKIWQMEIRDLVSLPTVPYRNDGRYDKMGQSQEPWEIHQPIQGRIKPEAAFAIENIINRWVYGNRRGKMREFVERYMKNPLGRNHMLIRSLGPKTRPQENLTEIREKIGGMDAQYRNRYYTFHAPTTPVIQMDETGERARGTWFDHAATNLRSQAKSPEHVPYMVFVNKYVHEFQKIEGRWYLVDFYSEPLISLPDWELDLVHSRGYLSREDSAHFPELFELGGEAYEMFREVSD